MGCYLVLFASQIGHYNIFGGCYLVLFASQIGDYKILLGVCWCYLLPRSVTINKGVIWVLFVSQVGNKENLVSGCYLREVSTRWPLLFSLLFHLYLGERKPSFTHLFCTSSVILNGVDGVATPGTLTALMGGEWSRQNHAPQRPQQNGHSKPRGWFKSSQF